MRWRCKNEDAYCENRPHYALVALHRGEVARSCDRTVVGVAVVTRPQVTREPWFCRLRRSVLPRLMLGVEGADYFSTVGSSPASKVKALNLAIRGPYFCPYVGRLPYVANAPWIGVSATPTGVLLFPRLLYGEVLCPRRSIMRCNMVRCVFCSEEWAADINPRAGATLRSRSPETVEVWSQAEWYQHRRAFCCNRSSVDTPIG